MSELFFFLLNVSMCKYKLYIHSKLCQIFFCKINHKNIFFAVQCVCARRYKYSSKESMMIWFFSLFICSLYKSTLYLTNKYSAMFFMNHYCLKLKKMHNIKSNYPFYFLKWKYILCFCKNFIVKNSFDCCVKILRLITNLLAEDSPPPY